MQSFEALRNRHPRPARSHAEDIATGLAVVLVGLFFLARNLGFGLPFPAWHNAWALFILVGAVSPARKAFVRFRLAGQVDGVVAHRAIQALTVAVVALMFLLDVSFATWWPVFVVIGGLYAMFPGRGDRR